MLHYSKWKALLKDVREVLKNNNEMCQLSHFYKLDQNNADATPGVLEGAEL